MPTFFFHLSSRIGRIPDREGRELPDLGAARSAAVDDIRSLLGEDVRLGVLDLRGRIEIADDAGRVAATVAFRDAVQLTLDEGS